MDAEVVRIDVRKTLRSPGGSVTLNLQADIPPGSLTAVFGPSGAGKTMMLRMLSGLTRPDEGVIQAGSAVWYDSSRRINVSPQKRGIGMMFQDYALFPNMTVRAQIAFAMPEADAGFVDKLVDLLGLSDCAAKKPGHLSGGQKQRVALARALARRPRLLLLDEPLSALDTELRLALQEEISRAHTMFGSTTVFVSHDVHEVLKLATWLVRLEEGLVKSTGDPKSLFMGAPSTGYIQLEGRVESVGRDSGGVYAVMIPDSAPISVRVGESESGVLASGGKIRVSARIEGMAGSSGS
jgi:molybdate transport system ATP-binding protein